MPTIKFRLKSQEKKKVSIYMRVSINRNNVFELNTGFAINPNDWGKLNLPKQNNENNKVLHSDLKKLDTFILDNLNKDLASGLLIDKYYLQNKIKECFNRVERVDTGLILNHIQYIIDNANTRKIPGRKKLGLSANRIKGYITFKNLFEIYQTEIKKQINFLDVNKTFVDKFVNWLVNTKKYSINYSGKQIDNLKTVCIDAEKLNIPVNPYISQIQGFSEEDNDRFIHTLSFDEIEQIRTADITKPELVNARNWLLIGCEIGQRVGDLMSITQDNIRYQNNNIYLEIDHAARSSITSDVSPQTG